MKKLFAIPFILLAACADQGGPILRTPDHTVFIPDDQLFVCPIVTDFPNPATLTDTQIAELLVVLDTNNRICKSSINSIRNALISAKRNLEATE